jgi:hypothetical protein
MQKIVSKKQRIHIDWEVRLNFVSVMGVMFVSSFANAAAFSRPDQDMPLPDHGLQMDPSIPDTAQHAWYLYVAVVSSHSSKQHCSSIGFYDLAVKNATPRTAVFPVSRPFLRGPDERILHRL